MEDEKGIDTDRTAARELVDILEDDIRHGNYPTVIVFAVEGALLAEQVAWIEGRLGASGRRLGTDSFGVGVEGTDGATGFLEELVRLFQEETGTKMVLSAGVVSYSDIKECASPGTEALIIKTAESLLVEARKQGAGTVLSLPTEPVGGAALQAFTLCFYRDLARFNAERARRMENESRSDFLTGLSNRRGFEEDFARMVGRARHGLVPLALAYMDSDSLKKINDTAGHDAGDRFLGLLAVTLKDVVRHSDLISRWGADEFAVAGPCASEAEAGALAERIRSAVEKSTQGTVSVGVYWGVPADAAEALKVADEALYRAKRAGKNQIVFGHA
jgi:diguanylate cyclase (GGDEF)-like protein